MLQIVADDDDADAAFAHVSDQIEHPPAFLDAERGHRLVHDHELYLLEEEPADRNRLALAAGEPDDRIVQPRQVNAEAIEQLDRALPHPAVVELWNDAEEPGAKLAAEKYVLRNVEGVDETEALMKATDAGRIGVAGVRSRTGSPSISMRPPSGGLSTGQRLDQGGLPCPVVADQGQDLTAMDIEGDGVHRLEAA